MIVWLSPGELGFRASKKTQGYEYLIQFMSSTSVHAGSQLLAESTHSRRCEHANMTTVKFHTVLYYRTRNIQQRPQQVFERQHIVFQILGSQMDLICSIGNLVVVMVHRLHA